MFNGSASLYWHAVVILDSSAGIPLGVGHDPMLGYLQGIQLQSNTTSAVSMGSTGVLESTSITTGDYSQGIQVQSNTTSGASGASTMAPKNGSVTMDSYSQGIQVQSNTTYIGSLGSTTESVTVTANTSTVPIIWDLELNDAYKELGDALTEMTLLEESDEWSIDTPVYTTACYVATWLKESLFPAPQIFNHGRKSVVFNWSNRGDNLYLTISADCISALISSPGRIKRRADYSPKQFADPSAALASIKAIYTEKPVQRLITGSVSATPELADFVR